MSDSSLLPVKAQSPAAAPLEPVGPLIATLRYPLLVLVPLLVLLGVAAAIGVSHRATYTAEALLNVGRPNVPAYTLQGVLQGDAVLASNYARAIGSAPVYQGAAARAGVAPSTARADLSASPIPESTLIRVVAQSHNKREAIAVANAGARSLLRFVQTLNRDPAANALLSQYRAVQKHLEQLRVQIGLLKSHPGKSVALAVRKLEQADVDLAVSTLRAQDLSNQYYGVRANQPSPSAVQLLKPATTASSDYTSVLEQILLIGAVGGAALGAILALVLANREWLRRIA